MSGTLAKINHETQNAFSGVFETHQELCEDNDATVGSTRNTQRKNLERWAFKKFREVCERFKQPQKRTHLKNH